MCPVRDTVAPWLDTVSTGTLITYACRLEHTVYVVIKRVPVCASFGGATLYASRDRSFPTG